MATKWIKGINPGVRYRFHPSRKHNNKPDRYYAVYFRIDKTLHEKGIGWASQGWNERKALDERDIFIESYKTGIGPTSKKEQKELIRKENEELLKKEAANNARNITLKDFFNEKYIVNANTHKSEKSTKRERELFAKWISPEIGDIPVTDITTNQVDKIKSNIINNGLSTRTAEYCIAVLRQITNYASNFFDIYTDIKFKAIKLPKFDNRRERFLTKEEASKLLDELENRNLMLHEICTFSLMTGARANEILSLKWGDINSETKTIVLWDTKSSKNRTVQINTEIETLLKRKQRGLGSELVFQGKNGNKLSEISRTFNDVVNNLGFNENISDPRQKVVFHTLRHTFASWLAQEGVDIYHLSRLMGHSTLAMTQRYAHLSNGVLQNAVNKLNGTISADKENGTML